MVVSCVHENVHVIGVSLTVVSQSCFDPAHCKSGNKCGQPHVSFIVTLPLQYLQKHIDVYFKQIIVQEHIKEMKKSFCLKTNKQYIH